MRTWRVIWHDIIVRLGYYLIMWPFVAVGFVWFQVKLAISIGEDAGDKFLEWVITETPKDKRE